MKTFILSIWLVSLAFISSAQTGEPRLTSWFTTESTRYARVRETDSSPAAGATTWTGHTLPAYAGVQEIAYDSSWVYVRSYGLAGYVMGPWYLNAARTQLFPNRPLAATRIRRITRNPAPASAKSLTTLGAIGMYVNGVSLFDNRDGFAWNGSSEAGNGQGYWQRDAWVNEGITFDTGYAHQEQTGNYHYHAFPPALRYQLGDNVTYDAGSGRYLENTNGLRHSPILAWVADGFPIYGPYGYADATNASSAVRRIVSGYVLRNGQKGTDNLAVTGRLTIPAWAQRAYGVGANQSGPSVNTTYPLGRYLEDNVYLGDLTNSATGQRYAMGVDFDLNEWNCRWCVTPEFPNGTWAYFCTLTESNTPAFPYAVGRQFFGTPDTASLSAIPAAATNVFKGGPERAEAVQPPALKGQDIVLTWSGVEGGTYRVESASNLVAFSAIATNVSLTSTSGSVTNVGGANGGWRFYRTARTGLAPYYGDGTITTNTVTGAFSVSPDSAVSGAVGVLVTFTFSANASPPLPPAQIVPSSVMIGSINGSSIARPSSTVVTAMFNFNGAAAGTHTATISFPGPSGAGPSYSVTGAFKIN